MKKLVLLLFAFLSTCAIQAHNVIWAENQDGFPFIPGAPLTPSPLSIDIYQEDLFSLNPPSAIIQIVPDYGFEEVGAPIPIPFFEPCTVYVDIDPPESPLLGVEL